MLQHRPSLGGEWGRLEPDFSRPFQANIRSVPDQAGLVLASGNDPELEIPGQDDLGNIPSRISDEHNQCVPNSNSPRNMSGEKVWSYPQEPTPATFRTHCPEQSDVQSPNRLHTSSLL